MDLTIPAIKGAQQNRQSRGQFTASTDRYLGSGESGEGIRDYIANLNAYQTRPTYQGSLLHSSLESLSLRKLNSNAKLDEK